MPRYQVEPAWEALVYKLWTGAPAPHGATVRWTYTVPADHYAILDHVEAAGQHTTSPGQVYAQVRLNVPGIGTVAYALILRSRTDVWEAKEYRPGVVLDEGSSVDAVSTNTDGSAKNIIISAALREMVK